MASCPRGEIVREGEVGVYHVWTRCMRRAFLCGIDRLTGQDYNHRRDWIRAFQQRLASLFALEIGFHVELSNHIHLVLRARPDVVGSWSDLATKSDSYFSQAVGRAAQVVEAAKQAGWHWYRGRARCAELFS